MAAVPLSAQEHQYQAAVFALLDSNEWCPGGSVYLDLESGAFLLHPRPARPDCYEADSARPVEHGTLAGPQLSGIRSIYRDARQAGLRRDECDLVVSNGGPQSVVITSPGYSDQSPENLGCWSAEASVLYKELFKVFGEQRRRRD